MGRKDVSEDDLHVFVDGQLAALGAAPVLAPPPPPLSELAQALRLRHGGRVPPRPRRPALPSQGDGSRARPPYPPVVIRG